MIKIMKTGFMMVIMALMLVPLVIYDAEAFKLTDYEMNVKVQFLNDGNVDTNTLVSEFDNGLMEQIIFENLDPVAVGQWSIDDIISDNSLSSSNFPTFHEDVMLLDSSLTDITTNTILVLDPVITEINTAQGVNKATIQDQIISDTQRALRDSLVSFGIKEFLWDLTFDQGVIRFAEKLP